MRAEEKRMERERGGERRGRLFIFRVESMIQGSFGESKRR